MKTIVPFITNSSTRKVHIKNGIPQRTISSSINNHDPNSIRVSKLSIAPMMEFTDRHYRYLMRMMTKHTEFYTEMVVDRTIYYNAQEKEKLDKYLGYHTIEHPLVLQLGGSEVNEMTEAIKVCMDYNYRQINLNVGCPSPKVQKGCFGASLMKEPKLVADVTRTMIETVHTVAKQKGIQPIPVTVKCRIGVDDLDTYDHLAKFIETVSEGSKVVVNHGGSNTEEKVTHFIIHARKALLKGLSPKENRSVPPLNYDMAGKLLQDFPHLQFTLNGGISNLDEVEEHLAKGFHGVMIGRAAVKNPWIFAEADKRIFGDKDSLVANEKDQEFKLGIIEHYLKYAEEQQEVTKLPATILLKPLEWFFSKKFYKQDLTGWKQAKIISAAQNNFAQNKHLIRGYL